MFFRDTEGSEFLTVWDLSRSFQSNMIAPHVIRQPWESVSHPKKENLRDRRYVRYGRLPVLHRLWQRKKGFIHEFIHKFITSAIVLKHHYWKCVKNKHFGQNK